MEENGLANCVTELKFHLADSYRQYTICVHEFQRSKLTIDELIIKGLSINQNLKVYNIISLFPQEVEFLIKLALFQLWLLITDKMCRNTNTHVCSHTHTHNLTSYYWKLTLVASNNSLACSSAVVRSSVIRTLSKIVPDLTCLQGKYKGYERIRRIVIQHCRPITKGSNSVEGVLSKWRKYVFLSAL